MMEKSSVYRSCGECDAFYLGQTGRQLSIRFYEHKTEANSAFHAHCIATGHDTDKAWAVLLHQCSGGQLMNRLEEVETVKAPTENVLD